MTLKENRKRFKSKVRILNRMFLFLKICFMYQLHYHGTTAHIGSN